MSRPIFFDPSGRRKRWSLRGLLFALLLILVAAAILAATVVAVPVPAPLSLGMERAQPRALPAQIAHLKRRVNRGLRALGLWSLPAAKAKPTDPTTVGFYAPWDDASRASLLRHANSLDWVVPAFVGVVGPAHTFTYTPDARFARILAAATQRPKVLPMVQNISGGDWDGPGAAALLASPAARARLLDQLTPVLAREQAIGVVFDLESLPATAQPGYRRLLIEARARFAPQHLLVTVTVPVADESWDLRAYARIVDRVFIMAYDEHSEPGDPGPIASQPWFVDQLRGSIAAVGPAKAIVTLGSYAYDWHGKSADAMTVEEAWLAAHDSGASIRFDQASGNTGFGYDDDGVQHSVWMLDAASLWNELKAVRATGAGGIALWRLGSEDPGVWPMLDAPDAPRPPDIGTIRPVGNVDVEGTGELLRITHTPELGHRTLDVDARGLVRGEVFSALPSPFQVARTAGAKGDLALTFDDGPDGTWTPRILDVLRAKDVPATFFVIGENAVQHPTLLNRIIAEGSELGNHSYTHPNLALVSPRGTRIELNLTQRVIEAYTGRSTRLFRAPYFGDAEPTTTDELIPALLAQEDGYLNVGLHVDTEDWQRPGVAAIIANAVTAIQQTTPEKSGQIILLHDGGGDRSQTVAALPLLIDRLRAMGYRFVPVSTLAGVPITQAMPKVIGRDLLAVRADIGIFLIVAGVQTLFKWLFFVAITLGIARAVLMAALAIRSKADSAHFAAPPIDPTRFVSVIIPAYNEARVIEASVARVLASTDVSLEVIVADDGSSDETSAIVARAYGGDPRVRLMTLPNGGKASALNRAMQAASGEVIVALDADTQFEPETIARLVRWFDDPELGAVAGNAKVGNRVNLVTRWQAVEYVTAQNLERRALARFDAITVVPGAVGAWRRAALDAVGGYPEDTLAEDQDLTIAIQRKGWHVGYDVEAVAWTEAPETFRALSKQRFRWAFGTLQCLWKHRAILRERRPAGLALVGLPQAWLFQIFFAVISPIIDLALVASMVSTVVRVQQHGWAQTQSDVLRMAVYWLSFTAIDVLCGWIAYRLEPRERHYPAVLLVMQRFIYRQLMYSVVVRAVIAAVSGPWVGWGKLERSGRVGAAA